MPAGRFAGTIRHDSPDGCAIALLGLPDDTGVGLNNGRPGAKDGPAAFRAALDHLADVGLRRRYGESRERFASRLATAFPSLARLTAQHLGSSLGSRQVCPAGDFENIRRQLADELGENIPTWRRWLGALDPISWMWVR